MPIGIDHVVIAVNDLDAATRNFQDAGFTVVPGGEHHSGASANVLVAFQDGSYLEIIAFTGDQPAKDAGWSDVLAESGEGLVDFALRTNDLDREVTDLTTRGLHVIGPVAGGRVRPDGARVDWRTIRFEEPGLPFYCHDETERDLRVPHGEQAVHANGVTGIQRIVVPARDESAFASWQQLTGLDGNTIPGGTRFAVGNQGVDVVTSESTRPLRLVLLAPTGAGEALPLDQTHGAEIVLSSFSAVS